MIDMEISGDYSASSDQTIVKGKRTKRPRLSISTSSSGGNFNNSPPSSPTTSSGMSTSTEEDEDMANCLILLASSGGLSGEVKPPEIKFSSRKFTEMTTTTTTANGKIAIYVYECKTCSRAFPSFQALGGHRASHKKPKIAADCDDRKKSPPRAPPITDREDRLPGGKFTNLSTITTSMPNSTQLGNKINCHGDYQIKPKMHECSICGSEFGSGQALGGHMRRHRSAIANTRSRNDAHATTSSHVMVLDLNLPAPPEDDRREMKFHSFSSPPPPPRLVFSAAALVDCHY